MVEFWFEGVVRLFVVSFPGNESIVVVHVFLFFLIDTFFPRSSRPLSIQSWAESLA
jgi:hypothetical protein